tara:strand:+ start:66 stop:596 length:531 start_codon:yes stop_codon:yes gene_type:complete
MNCITFDVFTQEQVKEINKKIKSNLAHKMPQKQAAQNVNKIGDFTYVPVTPLMDLLYPFLNNCQQLNTDSFGYDIYWHFHLEAFAYNVYEASGEYGWHIDSTTEKDKPDFKLTCLLNLSEEPYEGGEFSVVHYDEDIPFASGMGMVFTSMMAHKVAPVTKGERITLTYWAQGPSWR